MGAAATAVAETPHQASDGDLAAEGRHEAARGEEVDGSVLQIVAELRDALECERGGGVILAPLGLGGGGDPREAPGFTLEEKASAANDAGTTH